MKQVDKDRIIKEIAMIFFSIERYIRDDPKKDDPKKMYILDSFGRLIKYIDEIEND